MIEIALALALQPGIYTDDAGCKWRRRPVVTKQAAKPAKAASAPVVPVAKKKPAKARPKAPDDDFIGCDPEGFGIWRVDLELPPLEPIPVEPPTIEIVTYERTPELVQPLPAESRTFDELCNCALPLPVGSYPVASPPIYLIQIPPPVPTTPVPEPSTWLLLLAGVAALKYRHAKTKP